MTQQRWNPANDAWLVEAYTNLPMKELTDRLGVCRATIHHRLHKLGIEVRSRGVQQQNDVQPGDGECRRPRQIMSDAAIARLYGAMRYDSDRGFQTREHNKQWWSFWWRC